MIKNGKTKPKKENLLNVIARNVAEIKETMATKDDIVNMATKDDLKVLELKLTGKMDDVERKLSNKIDAVDEKVDGLEETSIRGLEYRVSALEKDVKQIKQKHV